MDISKENYLLGILPKNWDHTLLVGTKLHLFLQIAWDGSLTSSSLLNPNLYDLVSPAIFQHPENRGISLCDTHLQSGAQPKIFQPGFGATQSNIDFRPALERQVILLKILWHCEMTPSHFFIEQKNHLVCHNNAFGNIDYVIGVSSWPSKCRSSRSYEASLIPFQQRTLQIGYCLLVLSRCGIEMQSERWYCNPLHRPLLQSQFCRSWDLRGQYWTSQLG